MNATATISRLATLCALAGACAGANAQPFSETGFVWVENAKVRFETCSSTMTNVGEKAVAALPALRDRAATDIDAALRQGGVAIADQQFMSFTPLSVSLACDGVDSAATFRVAAEDKVSGKFWSMDLNVRGDAAVAHRSVVSQLAEDLASSFRGVQFSAAKF